MKDFKVAWRKIKRRIWRLPYRAHNAIVHQLSYDIDHQLETRMIKFVHLCFFCEKDFIEKSAKKLYNYLHNI